MRKVVVVLGGAFLGVTLLASASLAQRSDPTKANKFQSTLVTAYAPCTVPNDTTAGSLPLLACAPAVPGDDVCTIDAGGGGKVQAKADAAGDVALKAKIKGIANCEGDKLKAYAGIRVTTNNCTSANPGGCTTQDQLFPVTAAGDCTIDGGKCGIKTTVNAELGAGTLTAGENTSITLNGVQLVRSTNVNGGTPGAVAAAGLALP